MRHTTTAALACAFCFSLPTYSLAAPRGFADPSYVYYSSDAGYLSAQGSHATTFDAGVGYRFNRYYAIEGGYEGVFLGGVSINGGYLDAYGYLPLGRRSSVSLFATGGASYVSSVFIYGTGYYASAFGVRGGGGVEWKFGDKWAIRAAVRYQTTVTSAVVASIGFTVHL